jgi:hypothetical protein
VAALVMSLGYANTETRDRICQSAENVGLAENECGCGLVDAEAAVGC